MTFNAHLLEPTSVHRTETGYQLSLGLPWYRSLPWSCIEDIEVRIDEEVWPFSDLTVVIDGIAVDSHELADRWDRYWYLQDRVLVQLSSALSTAKQADVSVSIALLLPNVLIEGTAATVRTDSRKQLQILEPKK